MPRKYVLIHSDRSLEEQKKLEYCHYYMDYDEFRTLAIDLVTEISKWLKKYGADNINFPEHMLRK